MLGSKKYEAIFGGIIYFIGLKSGIQKNKFDSDDDLPLEKTCAILFKPVFNKNHDQHYYKTFLEKCID